MTAASTKASKARKTSGAKRKTAQQQALEATFRAWEYTYANRGKRLIEDTTQNGEQPPQPKRRKPVPELVQTRYEAHHGKKP